MVWFGLVWFGLAWFGVVWCGMVFALTPAPRPPPQYYGQVDQFSTEPPRQYTQLGDYQDSGVVLNEILV